MKKIIGLLFGAALALFAAAPAAAQTIDCRQTAFYDASTNGATKIISGATRPSIYICGFNIWAGGTATVKLVTGTGTNCATNTVSITPAYSLVAQTGVPDSSAFWRGLLAGPGLDVCIVTSAGVAIQGQFYYVQR